MVQKLVLNTNFLIGFIVFCCEIWVKLYRKMMRFYCVLQKKNNETEKVGNVYKTKKVSYLYRTATTFLPLLRSRPGGVQRELVVQDLPECKSTTIF